MKMKILIGMLMIVLLVPGLVQGLTWVQSCLDEDTMYETATLNISDTLYPLQNIVECDYNCSTDFQKCNPPPREKADDSVLIAIIVGLAIITSLFFYLAINLTISRDAESGPIKHSHLQPLFFLFGMIFITVLFFIMGQYAESSSQAGIMNVMWIMYTLSLFIDLFVGTYVLIIFIKSVGDWWDARSKERKEKGM